MDIVDNNHALKDIILEVSEIAEYLWQRGWAERNAGNISVNVSALIGTVPGGMEGLPYFDLPAGYPELANMYFFVSGTGKRMRDLARDPLKNAMIIHLNEQGNGYHIISRQKDKVTDFKPTSELPTHLGIHHMIRKRGTDETVVIHTHANELVALTQIEKFCNQETLNKLLWGMHPETIVFIPEGVGFVPYLTPGTQQIADATIKALGKHQVALWEKHGVFAIGSDVFDTFDLIDILGKSAKIYFLAMSSGHEPQGLNNKQLEILKEVSKNF